MPNWLSKLLPVDECFENWLKLAEKWIQLEHYCLPYLAFHYFYPSIYVVFTVHWHSASSYYGMTTQLENMQFQQKNCVSFCIVTINCTVSHVCNWAWSIPTSKSSGPLPRRIISLSRLSCLAIEDTSTGLSSSAIFGMPIAFTACVFPW